MGIFFSRPATVVPQFGHPILRGQSLWLVANDKSGAPVDLLNRGYAAMNASITSYGNTAWGKSFLGNAAGQVDLGASNRFLLGDTQPCSLAWVEQHTGAQNNQGIFHLKPAGSTKSFGILRISQNTVGPTTYGRLSSLQFNTANAPGAGFLGPPLLSDNRILVFVMTFAGGITDNTAGKVIVYWGPEPSGTEVNSLTNQVAVAAATVNYFGWDNIDNKYTGGLDNARIWNRVLSPTEAHSVIFDPYVGSLRDPNGNGEPS